MKNIKTNALIMHDISTLFAVSLGNDRKKTIKIMIGYVFNN